METTLFPPLDTGGKYAFFPENIMVELMIFSFSLILLVAVALVICKAKVKTERGINLLILVGALLTVCSHYSSIIYHLVRDGSAMEFLRGNPNYLLPIYPCNVVMWSAVVYGLLKDPRSKGAEMLADYIFWFGSAACVVGMFANVDFIRNPGFSDYDACRSVFTHGFMFFSILLLPVFGRIKIDLPKNMRSILFSIIGMFLIGLFINLLFEVLTTYENAWNVNSMFILHSPFDGLPFLKYPVIALLAVMVYFIIFNVCELVAYKRGNRWISRIRRHTVRS